MKTISLLKCHGSGNDFILLDEIDSILIAEQHKAEVSRQLCDRHLGFGSDGVLYVSASQSADCTMRMFNPDGSEAQMCGNGLRCVARHYCEHYSKTDRVSIETPRATLRCTRDRSDNGVVFYQTEIGPVSFEPETLPVKQNQAVENQIIPQLDDSLRWYGLSITNPHLVAIVAKDRNYDLESIGETANSIDLFPEGINCSLISSCGTDGIFVRTYERGAGLTNACGTAMAASCFIAATTGLIEPNTRVTVQNPGGKVYATAPARTGEMVLLSGNATFVYSSQCLYDPVQGQICGEIGAYNRLINNLSRNKIVS